MSIQNSINSMIGTAGVAAAAGKHIQEQELANKIAVSKELGEINIAENELKKDKKAYNMLKTDYDIAKETNEGTQIGDLVVDNEGNERKVNFAEKQGLVEAMDTAKARLDEFYKAKGLQAVSFAKRQEQLKLRKQLLDMSQGGTK